MSIHNHNFFVALGFGHHGEMVIEAHLWTQYLHLQCVRVSAVMTLSFPGRGQVMPRARDRKLTWTDLFCLFLLQNVSTLWQFVDLLILYESPGKVSFPRASRRNENRSIVSHSYFFFVVKNKKGVATSLCQVANRQICSTQWH
jgi:hypothetical protein